MRWHIHPTERHARFWYREFSSKTLELGPNVRNALYRLAIVLAGAHADLTHGRWLPVAELYAAYERHPSVWLEWEHLSVLATPGYLVWFAGSERVQETTWLDPLPGFVTPMGWRGTLPGKVRARWLTFPFREEI